MHMHVLIITRHTVFSKPTEELLLSQPAPICMCGPVWILKAYTGQLRRTAVRWLLFRTSAASPASLALFLEKRDFSFSWMLETFCEWLSAQPTVS